MLTIGGTAFLLPSACRHAARTISSTCLNLSQLRLKLFEKQAALRLVSEEPINVSSDKSLPMKWFPADCLHRTDFHGRRCSSFSKLEILNPKSKLRFVSYCRILRCSSIQQSAIWLIAKPVGRKFYLRTVIVTAAVYWGFGRQLHPRANRLP